MEPNEPRDVGLFFLDLGTQRPMMMTTTTTSMLPEDQPCGIASTVQFHESIAPSAMESYGGAIRLGHSASVCGSCLHPGSGKAFLGQGSIDSMHESEAMALGLHEAYVEQTDMFEESAEERYKTEPTSAWFIALMTMLVLAIVLFYMFVVR